MDLRPLLSLISSDSALAEALADGGRQRDISMPRGMVPPALALLASGSVSSTTASSPAFSKKSRPSGRVSDSKEFGSKASGT